MTTTSAKRRLRALVTPGVEPQAGHRPDRNTAIELLRQTPGPATSHPEVTTA